MYTGVNESASPLHNSSQRLKHDVQNDVCQAMLYTIKQVPIMKPEVMPDAEAGAGAGAGASLARNTLQYLATHTAHLDALLRI